MSMFRKYHNHELKKKTMAPRGRATQQSRDTVLKSQSIGYTVKTVQNGHSNTYKTKILTTIGSLMKAESITGLCCNTFDLHYAIIGLETNLGLFESGRFTCIKR